VLPLHAPHFFPQSGELDGGFKMSQNVFFCFNHYFKELYENALREIAKKRGGEAGGESN
jgi:hypothetical protein